MDPAENGGHGVRRRGMAGAEFSVRTSAIALGVLQNGTGPATRRDGLSTGAPAMSSHEAGPVGRRQGPSGPPISPSPRSPPDRRRRPVAGPAPSRVPAPLMALWFDLQMAVSRQWPSTSPATTGVGCGRQKAWTRAPRVVGETEQLSGGPHGDLSLDHKLSRGRRRGQPGFVYDAYDRAVIAVTGQMIDFQAPAHALHLHDGSGPEVSFRDGWHWHPNSVSGRTPGDPGQTI